MVDQGLQYDMMVERALRGVLREALGYAAEHGLPGAHHFYIAFRTGHAGVELPDPLRERYPSEMTIILEHQFWDLEVGDEAFAVTLSFSDEPYRVSIPFDAVVAFADPSVRFDLQFDGGPEEGEQERGPPAEVRTLPVGKAAVGKAATAKSPRKDTAAATEDADGQAGGAEKIITLDSFRKR